MNNKERAALDASYDFIRLLWENVGTTADYPIDLQMDADIADAVCGGMNKAKKALKECGYQFSHIGNDVEV